jgi:hypothetical protein
MEKLVIVKMASISSPSRKCLLVKLSVNVCIVCEVRF